MPETPSVLDFLAKLARSQKGDNLKKLALLGAVAGLGVGALVVTHTSHAADHLDAPTISMAANRMADLNDVYAWMTSDDTKVKLAMTVSPAPETSNTS